MSRILDFELGVLGLVDITAYELVDPSGKPIYFADTGAARWLAGLAEDNVRGLLGGMIGQARHLAKWIGRYRSMTAASGGKPACGSSRTAMGAFCTCSRTSPFPNSDGFVEALGGGKRPRVTITVNGHSPKSWAAHHAGPALTQSEYPSRTQAVGDMLSISTMTSSSPEAPTSEATEAP